MCKEDPGINTKLSASFGPPHVAYLSGRIKLVYFFVSHSDDFSIHIQFFIKDSI